MKRSRIFRYETKQQKLLPLHRFVRRLALSLLFAAAIISAALSLGVAGYHWIARLSWIDSILNAAMILTGMGPVAAMTTTSSKLFASAYALFSGVVFLSATGVLLAPIFHRLMHAFHLAEEDR